MLYYGKAEIPLFPDGCRERVPFLATVQAESDGKHFFD